MKLEALIKNYNPSKADEILDQLSQLTEDELYELVMQDENQPLSVAALLELKNPIKLKEIVVNSKRANIRNFAINMLNDSVILKELAELAADDLAFVKAIKERASEVEQDQMLVKNEEALSVIVEETKNSNSNSNESFENIDKLLDSVETNSQKTTIIEKIVEKPVYMMPEAGELALVEGVLEKLSIIKESDNKEKFLEDLEQALNDIQSNSNIATLSVEQAHSFEMLAKKVKFIIKFIYWQLSNMDTISKSIEILDSPTIADFGLNVLSDTEQLVSNVQSELTKYNLSELEKYLLIDFDKLKEIVDKKSAKLAQTIKSKKENLEAHIQERIKDIADKIETGQFTQLEKKISNAEHRLKSLDKEVEAKYLAQFRSLRSEYFNKKNSFLSAVYPKQEELCKRIEELAENKDLSSTEIMKMLSQISKEWQQVSKGVDRQLYWHRFNQARTILADRLQMNISSSNNSELLKANNQKRQELSDELVAYVEKLKTTTPAIGEIVEQKSRLWKEWTAARPFDVNSQLKDTFKENMNYLEERLKTFYRDNYSQKLSLVNEVKSIISLPERGEAIKKCIKIQLEWKKIGNAGVHEAKLWKEFKESCDEIFKNAKDQPRPKKTQTQVAKEKNLLAEFFKELAVSIGSTDRAQAMVSLSMSYPRFAKFLEELSTNDEAFDRETFKKYLSMIELVLGLDSANNQRELKLQLLASKGLDNDTPDKKLSNVRDKLVYVLAATSVEVMDIQLSLLANLQSFAIKNRLRSF